MLLALALLCSTEAWASLGDGKHMTATINGLTPVKLVKHLIPQSEDVQFGAVDGAWFIISGPMKLKVTYDKAVLGEYKSFEVDAVGIKDGKEDYMSLFQTEDPAKQQVPVDQEVEIKIWDKFMKKFDQLPPGQYRLNLHVNGTKSWDRMTIALEVK